MPRRTPVPVLAVPVLLSILGMPPCMADDQGREARALHEAAVAILQAAPHDPVEAARAIAFLTEARDLLSNSSDPSDIEIRREISRNLYWTRKFQRLGATPPPAQDAQPRAAFERAESAGRSGDAAGARLAYEAIIRDFPGSPWALRASTRLTTREGPQSPPILPPAVPELPASPSTQQEGISALEESIGDRRIDDAWEWLARARRQENASTGGPAPLDRIEEDLAAVDWTLTRALASLLGQVGTEVTLPLQDGTTVRGRLTGTGPLGMTVRTTTDDRCVPFADLADDALAQAARATPYERALLALRSGRLETAAALLGGPAGTDPRSAPRLREAQSRLRRHPPLHPTER